MLSWMSHADTLLWLPASYLVAMVTALLATFLLLTPRSLGLWLPGVSLVGLFFLAENTRPYHRITVLDVGQGLSVVAESNQATMVYDVGAKFSANFDIGSRILTPFLRYSGVKELDLVAISHGDNDHAGGLDGLRHHFAIKQLATNIDLQGKVLETEPLPCLLGQQWHVGLLKLEVLWPQEDAISSGKSNNNSCVILLQLNRFSMLLTGDIERSVERRLLTSGLLPENIDVLIAPHHGSNTSSSKRFIEHLSPKHVIFSTGYKNRYGHPTTKVRERYHHIHSRTWNTADAGAIVMTLDENGKVEIASERETHPRPWY